jgi:CheY-like chemotaxis protein
MLPQVFDRFVQGGQQSDRPEGGLGLGLTIVRSLVERHGGTVSAHSAGRGHGSEFVVRLPRATRASLGHDERAEPPVEPVPTTQDHVRILVVDDNEDAANMVAAALKFKGYQTRIAYDGLAALNTATIFKPHVAVLDLGLPVLDGYELAARLRELPGMAAVSLIAVTGYGQPSDRQRTQDAGFAHHVVKPVDLDTLDSILASVTSHLR